MLVSTTSTTMTIWGAAVSLLVGCVLTTVVDAQMSECFDTSIGYENIYALNTDMEAEYQRIASGAATPQSMYLYRLCPETKFLIDKNNATTILRPLLDNSVFQCGDTGLVEENCQFSGGAYQIDVSPPDSASLVMSLVEFQGVSFTDFEESILIGPTATDATTVIIRDFSIFDFVLTGDSGIFELIAGSDPSPVPSSTSSSFGLNLVNGLIRDGAGTQQTDGTLGSLIYSVGGKILLQDIIVQNCVLKNLVHLQNPASELSFNNITIGGGSYSIVFEALSGAVLGGSMVDISTIAMTPTGTSPFFGSFYSGIFVLDDASSLTLNEMDVMGISMTGTTIVWTGITATRGSRAIASNVTFGGGSTLVGSVLNATGQASSLIADLVTIEQGGSNSVLGATVLGAAVFLEGGAIGQISRLQVDEFTEASAAIFVNDGSVAYVRNTCLNSGQTMAAVYVSAESLYTGESNYIDDTNYISGSICPDAGSRLVQESSGSSCFSTVATAPCKFECQNFAANTACLATATGLSDLPALAAVQSPVFTVIVTPTTPPEPTTAVPSGESGTTTTGTAAATTPTATDATATTAATDAPAESPGETPTSDTPPASSPSSSTSLPSVAAAAAGNIIMIVLCLISI